MRYFMILTFCLLIFSRVHPAHAEELVRVKLRKDFGDLNQLTIKVKGDYFSLDSHSQLKEGVTYHLKLRKGHLILSGSGEKLINPDSLVLIPSKYDKHHVLRVNNRPYLGAMEFVKEYQAIRPINQLPLEDYLKGVVPYEVFPSWPIETLKAQALAARTYAVSHQNQVMDDTISFQVYNGYTWNKKATRAVDETKGEVITYHNRLIDAYYSASNGGITQNNTNVWGGNAEPFYPIKKDPYDPVDPWKFTIHQTQLSLNQIFWLDPEGWDSLKEKDTAITSSIKSYLTRQGYSHDLKIIAIPKMAVHEKRDNGHRVMEGSITVEFMQRLYGGFITFHKLSFDHVSIQRIRPMIGGAIFKSYLVESVDKKNGKFIIKGRGNGHGVGMSQWGAAIMGKEGKNYHEILRFYFPGTKIKKVDS